MWNERELTKKSLSDREQHSHMLESERRSYPRDETKHQVKDQTKTLRRGSHLSVSGAISPTMYPFRYMSNFIPLYVGFSFGCPESGRLWLQFRPEP